jgi:hypothetical protein
VKSRLFVRETDDPSFGWDLAQVDLCNDWRTRRGLDVFCSCFAGPLSTVLLPWLTIDFKIQNDMTQSATAHAE